VSRHEARKGEEQGKGKKRELQFLDDSSEFSLLHPGCIMSEGESLHKATTSPSSMPISNLLVNETAEPALQVQVQVQVQAQAQAPSPNLQKPNLPAILPKLPGFQEQTPKTASARQAARKRRPTQPAALGEEETSLLPAEGELEPEAGEESDSISARSGRSLELRHTHKLAERRRRKELNDAFDSLEAAVRTQPDTALSKWDVLCEATDMIDSLRSTELALMARKELLLKEIDSLQATRK
jgi:hypothetical protein